MFRSVRAVLFDLDGTLIDSAPDLGAAADRMRQLRGMASLPLNRYRPMTGSGARGMLQVAFGITPAHADYGSLKEEFFTHYTECLLQRTQPFLEVQQLVEVLRERGLAWGVVTNKSERFTLPITRAMPLFSTAAAIVSGDTTPHAKPHPAPLLEAARRMSVSPAECVYVGDDERDIVAGRAAGMRTVAARYGYLGAGADVAAWGANAEVTSPLELLNFLEVA
ncbi:HAD-IA family hydrolase [Hydrogenophaga sp.]|uniref:HAD-IA family hydrolase n=1 Tax=Hydrogenophaga sp. TaxID=1904254 RepID=UPI003F721867